MKAVTIYCFTTVDRASNATLHQCYEHRLSKGCQSFRHQWLPIWQCPVSIAVPVPVVPPMPNSIGFGIWHASSDTNPCMPAHTCTTVCQCPSQSHSLPRGHAETTQLRVGHCKTAFQIQVLDDTIQKNDIKTNLFVNNLLFLILIIMKQH